MQQRNRAKKIAYTKRKKRYNRFTLLWLVLCFPIGFLRMWSSRCSWNTAAKYSVSGLVIAALAAAFVFPSPYEAPMGGLELYGDEPIVEIYGPELPENYVPGYVTAVLDSGVLPPEEENAEERLIVYSTEKQERYHLSTCKFAYASGRKLTLFEANLLGLKPCGLCQPPEYVPEQ